MASIRDLLLPVEDEEEPKPATRETRNTPSAAAEATGTEEAAPFHFQIEFILDTICPHCYLGLKNLMAAMQIHQQRLPGDTFEVIFSPLFLHRVASRSGEFASSLILSSPIIMDHSC